MSIAAERIDPSTVDDGVQRGELLVGVVIDPVLGDVFRAAPGRGAPATAGRSAARRRPTSARPWSPPGSPTTPTGGARQAEVLAGMIGRVRDIRRIGSAALDLCSVACGRVDAYYELGLAPWDMAAGALIAREAGAVVQRPRTAARRPASSVVAAPPALLEPARRALLLPTPTGARLDA